MKDGSGGTQEGRSRLHRLTFDDIRREHGGRYDLLLDGTEPHQMLDNMTEDGDGNFILQEDPGNQAYLARIWRFYPRNGALVEIAKHDPARFGDRNGANTSPATAPFFNDEDSSGAQLKSPTSFARPNRGRTEIASNASMRSNSSGQRATTVTFLASRRRTIRRVILSLSEVPSFISSQCRKMSAKLSDR